MRPGPGLAIVQLAASLLGGSLSMGNIDLRVTQVTPFETFHGVFWASDKELA